MFTADAASPLHCAGFAYLEPVISLSVVGRRRWLFLALVVASFLILSALFARVLLATAAGLPELLMLLGFAVAMPHTLVGFWNAMIGAWRLMRSSVRAGEADDYGLNSAPPVSSLAATCAVVMTLHNEPPEPIFARLDAMARSLAATGQAQAFCFVILSDTDDADIAAREDSLASAFKNTHTHGQTPIYRRRLHNVDYKAGNIMAFLDEAGRDHSKKDFDYFLPLDADSLMSGAVMVRLVAALEANPQIGILQTLVVGSPADSRFARMFQFGMRHAMRAFTAGAAWWSADCGPYWGHNALIRTAPFRAHCRLAHIPGRGALSGAVMSHDQLEAAYMRRAGFEVRVAGMETDSFEANPPTLADFIRRELRWCQGNLQYLFFLRAPGLARTSRVQLLLAMLMYLAPPAWILMTVAACARATHGGFAPQSVSLGLALFVVIFVLTIAPKIVGAASVAIQRDARSRYGHMARFGASVLLELLMSMLIAPIVALSITWFIIGLPFGCRLSWSAQNRAADSVDWLGAWRQMWPATLAGLVLTLWLGSASVWALVWAAPFLTGLLLSVPFAKATSARVATPWAARRLFVIPEEICPPAILLAPDAVRGPDAPQHYCRHADATLDQCRDNEC